MAKKTNTKANETKIEIQDTSTEVGYDYVLSNIVEEHNLSLRKIAKGLDLNYNMMLKKGKAAKAGEVYNPDVINWDAVEDYIRAKTGGPEEFDEIDWAEIAKTSTGTSSTSKLTLENFLVGTLLTLRGNRDQLYKVLFGNGTSIVIIPMANDEEPDFMGKPRVFGHATFFHQGPKPFYNDNSGNANNTSEEEA